MKKKILTISIICVIAIVAIVTYILAIKDKKYGVIKIEKGIATFTDYIVEFEIENENIIKLDHKETKSHAKKNEEGGSITEKYYFVGLNEGITIITFYKKDGNGEITEKHKYEVSVNKDLTVKITEK